MTFNINTKFISTNTIDLSIYSLISNSRDVHKISLKKAIQI